MKNRKKLIVILALTALMVAALCASAFAAEVVDSGVSRDGLSWSLDSDGMLRISGEGEMENYQVDWFGNNNTPWEYYRDQIKKVIISDGVQNVGSEAFWSCESLMTVELPNSVTYIGNDAFCWCRSLSSINLPDSITYIERQAFWDCESLRNVILPAGLEEISDSLFGECSSLEKVVIPDSVKIIGFRSFCSCSSMTDLYIGAGVTEIGSIAFESCTSLTDLFIPDGVTTIEDSAFSNCSSLKSVTIPDSAINIGTGVFMGCTSLTSVNIPHTWNSINESMFTWCESLNSIDIPANISSIEDNAFCGCSSLTEVYIPQYVSEIGDGVFSYCESLDKIQVSTNNPNFGNDTKGVLYSKDMTRLIMAPAGSMNDYSIPKGVKSIANEAFGGCRFLTRITIADGITSIGDNAFIDCTSLIVVDIPDSVSLLGLYSFFNCSKLSSVSFSNLLTSIENGSFKYCSSLKSVYIPKSITRIENYAFEYCPLEDIYYSGSKEAWESVYIGIDNDIRFTELHYNYKNPNLPHVAYSDGDKGLDRGFPFKKDEEVENLVLDTIATIYNPRLAHFLSNMARSAYNESLLADNYSELGIDILYHNYFGDENPLAGYYIGKRTLWDGSEMVFVTIRGTANTYQKATDLFMGTSISFGGWHDGFEVCVNRLYNNLKSQLGGTIPTKNIRYVITGHSLGAAVGNLLATKLNEDGVPKYNVYDYNFACPDVANDWPWAWNHNGEHNNIFNIGNCQDIITFVPGVVFDGLGPVWLQWGKYGQSVWFSENWNNLDYVMLNPPTHNMIYYVDYLAKERSFSEFRDYNGVHGEILKNQIKTLLFIQCPVDVTVYNSDGVPVAGVTGGEVNYYDSEVGDVLIFLNGDEKYIMLPDGDYTVSLTATDNGTMTYTVLTADPVSGESYGGTQFADVELTKGEGFISETSTSKDTTLYTADSNGKKSKEIKGEAVNSVTPVVQGDVNGDGELTNTDLVTVARYIVGLCDENTARIVEYMADMDGNNVVNNTDLVTVARLIVGL